MQTSAQIRPRSRSPLGRSKPFSEHHRQQEPASPAYSASGTNRKRERSDVHLDNPSSKKRLISNISELSGLLDKDGGLLNSHAVDKLHLLMQEGDDQQHKTSKKLKGSAVSRRTSLTAVIGATSRADCLQKFVQLGGLALLNDWLQDAHKGKLGEGCSGDSEKAVDELLLTLLHALEKLPVDLEALKSCNAGKSVRNLRNHPNAKIHRKAKKLVEIWRERVDAEAKQQQQGDDFRPVSSKPDELLSSSSRSHHHRPAPRKDSSLIPERRRGSPVSKGSHDKSNATATAAPSRNQSNGTHPQTESSCLPDERSSNSNKISSWSTTPPLKSNWRDDSRNLNTHASSSATHSRPLQLGKGGFNSNHPAKPLSRTSSIGSEKKPSSIKPEASAGTGNKEKLILRLTNSTSRNKDQPSSAPPPASADADGATKERKKRLHRLQNKENSAQKKAGVSLKSPSHHHHHHEEETGDDRHPQGGSCRQQRPSEMDCPSSESHSHSHLSFSSTECCTLDCTSNKSRHQLPKKKLHSGGFSNPSQENGAPPPANQIFAGSRSRHSSRLFSSPKFDALSPSPDANTGISLLASIAADENLRLQSSKASIPSPSSPLISAPIEVAAKPVCESARSVCLTDSENSPVSGVTESSSRMDAVPAEPHQKTPAEAEPTCSSQSQPKQSPPQDTSSAHDDRSSPEKDRARVAAVAAPEDCVASTAVSSNPSCPQPEGGAQDCNESNIPADAASAPMENEICRIQTNASTSETAAEGAQDETQAFCDDPDAKEAQAEVSDKVADHQPNSGDERNKEAANQIDETSKGADQTEKLASSADGEHPDEEKCAASASDLAPAEAKEEGEGECGRPSFDLNEGIISEEAEAAAAPSKTSISIPITPVASHMSGPIAMALIQESQSAAKTGEEMGWRGTAATSAFRPAEPRNHSLASVSASRPSLDFDLNDEPQADEDPIAPAKLNLDLNQNENQNQNQSDHNEKSAVADNPKESSIKHDFDLNAGLCAEEIPSVSAPASIAPDHLESVQNLWVSPVPVPCVAPPQGYGKSNGGFSVASVKFDGILQWNQTGIPSATSSSSMSAFPAIFASPYPINHRQTDSSGAACSSSAASSSSSVMQFLSPATTFSYGGYPFGYPSSTATAPASSFMDAYNPMAMAPHFVNSPLILPATARSSFIPGFADTVNGNGVWGKSGLDLNAGPALDLNFGPDNPIPKPQERRRLSQIGTAFPADQQMRVFGHAVTANEASWDFSKSKDSEEPSAGFKRKDADPAWDFYNRNGNSKQQRR
eukprot:TRINITY_DN14789_c0_g1_i2.p1 TRINITY_DN14789_c0_g1~~TRINITY_DN14789_c0_g1_i2.p1  ORF type:complete len:1283 (+),score=172.19 TRINITY_DN14789_c0_g1_i2:1969-5817(+)